MTKRPEASSEQELHRQILHREGVSGTAKGMGAGALVGAALKHTGSKFSPLHGAVTGGVLGALAGHHKGQERMLRDKVQQERMHQRAEARVKKSYDMAVFEAFSDELQKQSGVMDAITPAARAVGQGVMRLGGKAVNAASRAGTAGGPMTAAQNGLRTGFGKMVRAGAEMSGGHANLQRNLGLATGALGLGAAGVAGAGALAGRATA